MCCHSYLVFFFFKQKTAYEMRISDWSSDVCSSDLALYRPRILRTIFSGRRGRTLSRPAAATSISFMQVIRRFLISGSPLGSSAKVRPVTTCDDAATIAPRAARLSAIFAIFGVSGKSQTPLAPPRSEETTDEIQPLTRIQDAALCHQQTN